MCCKYICDNMNLKHLSDHAKHNDRFVISKERRYTMFLIETSFDALS